MYKHVMLSCDIMWYKHVYRSCVLSHDHMPSYHYLMITTSNKCMTRKYTVHDNGPIVATQEYYWWSQMSPWLSQVILLIPLHGPIDAAEEYCRWSRMGPGYLPINAANTLEWAYSFSEEMLAMLTQTGYPGSLCSKDVWVILILSVSILVPLWE